MTRSHHPDPFVRELADLTLEQVRDAKSEADPPDCAPEARFWWRAVAMHSDLLLTLIEHEVEECVPKVRAAFSEGTTDVDLDTEAGKLRLVQHCAVRVRIDWIDVELRAEGGTP